jgi:hypothetical protein
MTGDSGAASAEGLATGAPGDDSGLRCPRCGYNLTGLSAARCPECGTDIDWAAIATPPKPLIALEASRRWGRLRGFLVTWLTVLFAPWVFARQTERISLRHGLLFAGVCFACTPLAILFDADPETLIAWNLTAAIYLVLQTIALTLADPIGWKRPLRTAGFWLAIGGYTSAVVPTEIVYGPPILFLFELVEYWLGRQGGVGSLFTNEMEWLSATQMVVWLIGLACCFAARLRRHGVDMFAAVGAALLMAGCLLLLYAATIEHIGYRIWQAVGGSAF